MAVCEVCGINRGSRAISDVMFCNECFDKLQLLRRGDLDTIHFFLEQGNLSSATEKGFKYMTAQANSAKAKIDNYEAEMKSRKMDLVRAEQEEYDKQEFAHSFNEFYEYDVVTTVNTIDGHTDAAKLKQIIQSHAKRGWRLHTMYSNELGKNVVHVLGMGTNSTACEDVMIFERRIKENN